ncbi:DUF1269 domain-containing protein [Ramlibacter sp.]|uniref:DUF1269 domain-containing protein n=1 Tax=Ramlibacter sp. TaxID=1917967 RepID=UPI00260D7905|nr:DUF1269 domain-containing protein [Ramlibacter sp.]MDB5955278.1 hypothetical protein [Ramlibacter sp.]
MNDESKVVAVFADHIQAEAAIRNLQKAGFDMKKLSIIGRDYISEEQVLGYVNSGDRIRFWGKFGALWGALWGVLAGSAMLLLPGAGHIVVLGPVASALLNTAGGAALGAGAGALGGALSSIGLGRDAVVKYETAVRAGKFAVIAHGGADEAATAKRLLRQSAPDVLDEHSPTPQPA